RLARLDKRLTKDDREHLTALAGGVDLSTIVHQIVEALDPDHQMAAAAEGGVGTDEMAVAGVAITLIAAGLQPLASNPALRNAIVSLVRYALQQDDHLVPCHDQVEARFTAWLAAQKQQGTTFTLEQTQWLTWMKENIAAEMAIAPDSFDYTPFVEHGGLGKAH